MKKFKFLFIVAMLGTLFLQSCNSKVDGPSMVALVTIEESMMSAQWYAVVDNGDKIYPGNVSRIPGYKPKSGQRAMIAFTPMDEKVEGFAYNADIYQIDNVPTKDVQVVTEQSVLDTLGTSKVGINAIWIGGGYLNCNLLVLGSYYTQHYVNLVSNEITPQEDADYVNLELFVKMKNSNDNDNMNASPRSICFRLDDFDPKVIGKKGIKLTYRPIKESPEEIKTIIIDLDKNVSDL